MNYFQHMFIDIWREGDYFLGALVWLLHGAALLMVLFLLFWVVESIIWAYTPSFTRQCKLISISHQASTRRSHAVPVHTGNGMGVGVVTTGHAEAHITVWDCGEFGRLTVDDAEVFRWAQPESTLILKKRGEAVRIDGIVK